jgi:uncharacterized protein
MLQRHETRTIELTGGDSGLVAVISDTHGQSHPNLFPILDQRRPSLILHAGDMGNPALLRDLEALGQTVFVRGNVDPPGPNWPDSIDLHIRLGSTSQVDLLLLHFAVARLRLNKIALELLQKHPAQIIIYGHSHVPFLGMDGKRCLFNPGSAGPPRMGLPTTMGFIEISSGQLKFTHLNLKTGQGWKPG